MDTITITFPAHFDITACGVETSIDLREVKDTDSLVQAFSYGLGRLFQDRANSAASAANKAGTPMTDVQKRQYVEKLIADWKAAPLSGRGGESASPALSPIESLAVKWAKVTLMERFKDLTDKAKIADMCGVDDRVAAYFHESKDGKFTWKDGAVLAWIGSDKADDDYIARATKALSKAKAGGI